MMQPVQDWKTTRASAMAAAVLAALLFCIVSHAIAQDSMQGLRDLERTFTATYEQVKPAVAQIATTRQWRSARSGLPQFHPEIPEEALRGLGSGTIVSNDGYILSNYHVIEGADSILVTLADRRTFAAEVVGFDSLIDIALLKIEAH